MSDVALVDSGFVYALLDDKDKYHRQAWNLLGESRWDFRLPPETLVEVFHTRVQRLVSAYQAREYVTQAFAEVLPWLVDESPFRLERTTSVDYRRISVLLDRYADSGIDYVDAVVVAMAERLRTPYVMTTDERDFRRYVPNFTPHFILPIFDPVP